MISIYIPPTTPTKVATTTRTVAISQHIAPKNDLSFSCPLLTHPGPDSSVTSPSPSVEPPEPAPSKKRKRDPHEQPPNPRAPPKTPRKKRAPSGAPRGKRVQHLREESAPLPDNAVRNRSRTRERCTGPNRMGALESTIPVERWWREAQPVERTTQESSDAAHACSGQPTIGTEAPARKQIQSIDVVRPKWKGYRAWFRNPHNPDDPFWKFGPDNIPSAELEYPADNSTELYALVDALDHDDYQPLKDLFLTIDTIAGNYMDDADRTHIGYPNPITTLENDSSSQASPPSLYAHPHSPGRANRASSPTPMEPADSELPVYKRLVKARDTRDGPQFLQALATLNGYIRALRPNMQQHLRTKWTGIPPPVWKRVCDEGYQRGVGPRMRELVKYKQWTSGVYGELMQPFISEVIHRCGLGPGKVFVDLGSGVAHTLMQASLQSGCTSYGVELSPPAASIAKDHEREFNNRLEMWDLCCSEFKHIEGDMLESKEVLEWICKADVILVNNFVFEELLNERLTCLFLDARDGTQIVSLKCFLDRGFKITERTISSPQAILRVEERDWIAGAVSWSNTTGTYYVHTVDRSNLQAEEERLNAARSRPSRRRQVH